MLQVALQPRCIVGIRNLRTATGLWRLSADGRSTASCLKVSKSQSLKGDAKQLSSKRGWRNSATIQMTAAGASDASRANRGKPSQKRALISVSDKAGLPAFAKGLSKLGYELVSTGGSASAIEAAGLPVRRVEELTGFPEMLDGRVKTLHPAVHGGILARRDQPSHTQALQQHDIGTIDLVVVNLYPFRATVTAQQKPTFDVAIENIDIGAT